MSEEFDSSDKKKKVARPDRRSPEYYVEPGKKGEKSARLYAAIGRKAGAKSRDASSDSSFGSGNEFLDWVNRLAGIGDSGRSDISANKQRYMVEVFRKDSAPTGE